ncbi:hypothetical protein [uncultured Hymenobacter sp.]|uniref:hypothetical protein n=1 Tax=uncultured Hymenobacter sp. TaxID=170016 RepID=UPI0035CC838D
MKRLLVFIVLLALAAGGYYYYRSLQQGPEYALLQAARAATQTHDMATFERYVDVNSVTGHLVDQITNSGSLLGALNPSGLALKGALRLMKPQLTKAARSEVQRYVESGSLDGAAEGAPKVLGRGVSLAGLAGVVVSPESSFKGLKYSRQEGEQAFVGLEFTQPKYDTTMVLEVKLLHRGDHWQMTEITNTADLIQRVARLEKRRLLGGK